MIKCVIIDDEFHCVETLEILLSKSTVDVDIIGSFSDTDKAIAFINKNAIDILFIDIKMPKLNGFEFVEKVVGSSISVIFTTSYSDYAVKAFKVAAFGYLLKPISQKELNANLERWISEKGDTSIKLTQTGKLAITSRESTEVINVADITYCKSDNTYTQLFLQNKKTLVICKTMKSVANTLSDHGFVRVHQSYLVNTENITKYTKNELTLNDSIVIPVSKNYTSDLDKFFIKLK